jgi:heat shock protein HtpX
MNREEVEGVIGHEIAHIANGDMVTMTLLQGVINAFVMFFARAISFALSQQVKEENRWAVRFFSTMVLEIALGLLGALLVCWFSRQREFRADAGSAKYVGTGSMIAALKRLAPTVDQVDNSTPSLATMKISGKSLALFSTHPPLEQRIAALEGQKYR